jgi:hypothetical protein
MSNRLAGIISVKLNGEIKQAKGNWTYNLGEPKREAIVGADRTHGFKELPQVAFIEGEITDQSDLDLKGLLRTDDSTMTLELANGKVILLRNAWYASEGNVQTEEANIAVRFEGMSAEEVR